MSKKGKKGKAATKRVTVSEDGTFVTGPTLDSIAPYAPWLGVMSGDTALNYVTIYQCVRVLSNLYAQIPLMLYRRLANGGKERADDHPLYRPLHLQPNPSLTSFAWRRLMMVHMLTWGNHYSERTEDSFGNPQFWPIRPDRVEVGRDANGGKTYDYLHPDGGKKVRFPDGAIFHTTALSTDGLVGRSPITDLRSTLGLGKTAEQFGTSMFKNGARPAIVLKHPKTLSDPAVGRLTAQMDAMRGSGNAGKTVLFEEGLDFAEVGIPPDDAQFMETRLFQKRELAGAFGIPPHKIGDLERATFSNIEHQALELITDTMMPWYVNGEQEMSVQLLPDDDDVFAEFLVDGYLRGDTKTRNEAYAIRWQHGALNANEWRIKENDNPVEGGDTYFVPVNYQDATLAAPSEAGFRPQQPPPPPSDEGTPPELPSEFDSAVPFLTSTNGNGNGTKSLGGVRCEGRHRGIKCGRLLAESLTPPYRITCPRCKTVAETAVMVTA